MKPEYRIAIIGSGPAGLSAAARAATRGISHILLEAEGTPAKTIFRYQRGKHVMEEPANLPLRSDLKFAAGSRENVLKDWAAGTKSSGIKISVDKTVSKIEKHDDHFSIHYSNKQKITAESVVLAIGLQGNTRKLDVDGNDSPNLQYQLDDPKAYSAETIVIVGAGDSAIENALALAPQNKVILVNRRNEFARAKDVNNTSILAAIEAGKVSCLYDTRVFSITDQDSGGTQVKLIGSDGPVKIDCDRIIARIGALPPRKFVESCGVTFPSADLNSVPAVSEHYESNIPGLYIIGSLAGYPLIKQCMNQGYEVIEHISGNHIEPADEPVLKDKLKALPISDYADVNAGLAHIQSHLPLLQPLTKLQMRELMLDSTTHAPSPGEIIFRKNDYSSSFYAVVEGNVEVELVGDQGIKRVRLGETEFFGEMSLISGRRRSATVIAGENCVLLETPRRTMNKLIQSIDAVRQILDQTFMLRAIQASIAPSVTAAELTNVLTTASLEEFKTGDIIFREGDTGESLHLLRSGSVTVARDIGGQEKVLAYLPAGNYVGEMALLTDSPRSATVRAAVNTQTIRLEGAAFKELLANHPDVRERVEVEFRKRLVSNMGKAEQKETNNVVDFLMNQGVGEATDVLLIDESLCVRCDACEKACAATHGNLSRLNREAGPTFANVHVPTSCRHCEHPHCMKDCPPDAIHRAPGGEVFISDACIGCGNCVSNCPYDVIQLGAENPKKPSLIGWLMGWNPAPGESRDDAPAGTAAKAVKCDMCHGRKDQACVSACPTGAALRASPEEFVRHYQNAN